MREKILIVDDEKKMVKLIRTCLEQEGYSTTVAYDGEEGLAVLASESPDLVVLDVMMPKLDGLKFCGRVRESSDIPIVIISARSEEDDRLIGLEIGADDYVTKPFGMRELVARIRAILRRRAERAAGCDNDEVRCGRVWMSRTGHRVTVAGVEISLTRSEFDLLLLLASDPGRVFSRQELIENTQGEFFEGYERTIDAHIGNIRKKMAAADEGPGAVDTVYGVGYRFCE